ncbi:MAG: hypothetical protein GX800_09880 [Clostridiaceae bacterium]|nr:hypothetical protein [Clostridiaceae bacterium]
MEKNLKVITNASDINSELIPESAIENLARYVLNMADKIMSMPGMQEKYEKWKMSRTIDAMRTR